MLIQQLAKKQGANKLEKFLSDRLAEKLKDMQTDIQIKSKLNILDAKPLYFLQKTVYANLTCVDKLESVSRRAQDRMERLR